MQQVEASSQAKSSLLWKYQQIKLLLNIVDMDRISLNKFTYMGGQIEPYYTDQIFVMGTGGWLLTPFIGKIGHERFVELRKKVADEIDTTFSSKYTKTISLEETLHEENIFSYTKQATGEKFLIEPNN